MCEGDVYKAVIPIVHVLLREQLTNSVRFETLPDAVDVVTVGVEQKYWAAVRRLDDVLQRIQLHVVNFVHVVISIVYRTVAGLEQLIAQRSRRRSRYLRCTAYLLD